MRNFIEREEFLGYLEENCDVIIKEVEQLDKNKGKYERELKNTSYFNNKSLLNGLDGWKLVRFFTQGVPFLDFMRKHNLTPISTAPSTEEFTQFEEEYEFIYNNVFPNTYKLLHEFYSRNKGKFTNMSVFKLDSGVMLPVHTNFDPHIYRFHMGLIVPDGDIGMKVEGEERNWSRGKFWGFDSTRAHTVWNYTGKSRYVLSIDCFRPNIKLEDAHAVHTALVELRMKESKLTLGLSGGRSDLDITEKLKYASKHELQELLKTIR